MELKTVPLENKHISLGAKMVPFAGYNMPVRYSSDIDEHMAVRNAVGVFDVSHMGEFWVEGPKALDLLQMVTSNDVSKLFDGRVQYSCLPNKTGGIIDDLLVHRVNAEKYFLVVNASNIDKDWNWIYSHNSFGAKLTNVSDELCLFAVQGPKAIDTLQKLTKVDLKTIPYYHFAIGNFAGIDNIIISNTGYTGAGGFELYIQNKEASKVWDKIFEAGYEFGIKPIGLGARDTLRLEMGFALYGNDIDDNTSPIEAGLGWVTKFEKKFIGSELAHEIKTKGPQKKLVGFVMEERGIPRSHYEITDANGNKIGEVTSGTQSPILNKGIGMGYVDTSQSAVGNAIYIKIRENLIKAIITKPPFIKK
ncbi:MAG: glycine cleavage system aminomethyltransferase GcvT [Bacteroidota bacterium]|nr:glycine cleavage system aminomethyltransferase GcvT [Bacteroidota bacterium]